MTLIKICIFINTVIIFFYNGGENETGLIVIFATLLITYIMLTKKGENKGAWIYIIASIIVLIYLLPSISEFNSSIKNNNIHTYSENRTVEFLIYLSCCFLIYNICNIFVKVTSNNEIILFMITIIVTSALIDIVDMYTPTLEIINRIPPWGTIEKISLKGFNSYKNHMALQLAACMMLLYISKKYYELDTRVAAFTFLLLVLFLYMTDSRGIYVSLIIAIIIYNLHSKKYNLKKTIFIISIITFGIIILSTHSRSYSDNGRFDIWKTAYTTIEKSSIIGTGPGTYKDIQNAYKEPSLSINEMSKNTHNDYIRIIVEMGVFGLLFIFFGIFTYVNKLIKNRESKLPLSIILNMFLIHSCYDFVFSNLINIFMLSIITCIFLKDEKNSAECAYKIEKY